MAITEAMKETIRMQGLLDDLREVHCDRMSAIYLATNPVHHARTKRIDVHYHFIWELIEEGNILLKKVATKDNSAGMLTKVVPVPKFTHCTELVNISSI